MFTGRPITSKQFVTFDSEKEGIRLRLWKILKSGEYFEDGCSGELVLSNDIYGSYRHNVANPEEYEQVGSGLIYWGDVFKAIIDTIEIQRERYAAVCEDAEDFEERKFFAQKVFEIVEEGLKPQLIQIKGKSWNTLKTERERERRIVTLINLLYDEDLVDSFIDGLVDEVFEDEE